jgi:tetratricopeptide (TPR) repeat protein
MKRMEEAIAATEKALKNDPLSPAILTLVGSCYIQMGRWDEALATLQKAVELDSTYPSALFMLLSVNFKMGRLEESLRIGEDYLKHLGRHPFAVGSLGFIYARSNRINEAKRMLQDLHEQALNTHVPAAVFAMIYGGLEEIDKAFDILEKSVDDEPYAIMFTLHSIFFDPLRSHPRYKALLRKMNLEP